MVMQCETKTCTVAVIYSMSMIGPTTYKKHCSQNIQLTSLSKNPTMATLVSLPTYLPDSRWRKVQGLSSDGIDLLSESLWDKKRTHTLPNLLWISLVNSCGDTFPPITTCYVTSCDICYVKMCDTRLTHLLYFHILFTRNRRNRTQILFNKV